MTHPLSDNWVLWFHRVDDDNWSLDGYKNIYTLSSLEDFHKLFNTVFNLEMKMTANAGMFFLMREGVLPTWEAKANRNGGTFSYKVPKKDNNQLKSDIVWKKMVAACIGNTLTNKPDDMRYINGISISPKLDNCIFKVWNNDASKNNPKMITEIIDGIDSENAIYKRFLK